MLSLELDCWCLASGKLVSRWWASWDPVLALQSFPQVLCQATKFWPACVLVFFQCLEWFCPIPRFFCSLAFHRSCAASLLAAHKSQVFPSVRAIISRSAEGHLQGAVQAALGLMSAFTAAIGKFAQYFRSILPHCLRIAGPVSFGVLFQATSDFFPGTVFAVGSFFMVCSAVTMYITRASR